MKRLLLIAAAVLLPGVAAANPLPLEIITKADSLGVEIESADVLLQNPAYAARTESIVQALNDAVSLMSATDQTKLTRLCTSDELTLIADLDNVWEASATAFTNIDIGNWTCPRIFIHGSWLADTSVPDCRKSAVLTKELRHAARYIDGTIYPVYRQDGPRSYDDLCQVIDEETIGYLVLAEREQVLQCAPSPYTLAYMNGRLPQLRLAIYAFHRMRENYQEFATRLEKYARWCRPR